ncbi:MAG: TIGR04076 family protein [Planctomycetota bacterium]
MPRSGRARDFQDRTDRNLDKAAKNAETVPPIREERAESEGDAGAGPSAVDVVVEEVKGKCTSRMVRGNRYELRNGRLFLGPGQPVCLYALQSIIALLPSKGAVLAMGKDWPAEGCRVICPDPAGNVILRVDPRE